MKTEKLLTGGLEPATKKWIESVCRDWELEPHHVKLLILAGHHFDRVRQAQAVIARDGPTFLDRFSQPKLRPEIQIERDSSVVFSRLLRELSLDIEPPPETSRPHSGFVGKNKKQF